MPENRPNSRRRGYSPEWEAYRAQFLKRHPLCSWCAADGKVTRATVVDHITPHRGNTHLFWDANNHAALCKWHHDSTKQRAEKRAVTIGADGWPV